MDSFKSKLSQFNPNLRVKTLAYSYFLIYWLCAPYVIKCAHEPIALCLSPRRLGSMMCLVPQITMAAKKNEWVPTSEDAQIDVELYGTPCS